MITDGNSCGCRNNLLNLVKQADSMCSAPCSGAVKSTCGGTNNVWSINTALGKTSICARNMPRRLGVGEEDEDLAQTPWRI